MIKGVRKLYSEVAHTYELVNHVLTLGLDVYWRKKAARIAASKDGRHWLDVCSGTGEMAQNLSLLAEDGVMIISVDFSAPMLSKAMEKKNNADVYFVEAEAKELPFPDETFDLVTISFATRNISPNKDYLISHLREFYRVLTPEGRFINLETSQPSSKIIRQLFHSYINLFVKPIGTLISGSKPAYSYLSFTIPRFYPPDELSSIIHKAGFRKVLFKKLLFGVSAIHIAEK